jgi:hypothetical protein
LQQDASGKPFEARYEWSRIRKGRRGQVLEATWGGAIYRDGKGRQRIEQDTCVDGESVVADAEIYDVVDQVMYVLDVPSRTVVQRHILVDQPVPAPGWVILDCLIPRTAPSGGEFIGQKQIEALDCGGYRMPRPGGGSVECWYCEELMEIIALRGRTDWEEVKLRLFDIRRVEPPPELFRIPADYSTIAP